MDKNTIVKCRLVMIVSAVVLMMFVSCKPKVQVPQAVYDDEESANENVQPSDSVLQSSDSTLFTYQMAMEIIQPGNKCDEKFLADFFKGLGLPMQLAERYVSDADWGGDSPAISYCWGNGVKYEDYKFTSTEDQYFGVNFNFFFDDTRKTGRVPRFTIITSSEQWYNQFTKDFSADGWRFLSNVDPSVYGKKGKQYQKKAKADENTTEQPFYYIYDFSSNGHYDVEIGYDNGIDI